MNPITKVFSNHSNRHLLLAILCCFAYGYIGYFTARSEFYALILILAFTFTATYFIIQKSQFSFRQLLLLALVYRLVLLFTVPNLSQDFYRFYWDGQLLLEGLNPYLNTVNHYFSENLQRHIAQAELLREGMGDLSAGNYSNYPPFSQFIYAAATWLSPKSIPGFIIALRLILMGFDILFMALAKKLLTALQLNPKLLFWYSLNPLCIIEITGNLHLEGVMIALFITAIYALIKQKYALCGVVLSLSVGTKLLSLVALPLILVFIWRNTESSKKYPQILGLCLGFLATLSLQFWPFLDSTFLGNFSQSIGLWFGKFEFNASIYYIVRWLGYQVYGYNIIQTYGLIMPLLTLLIFALFIYNTKPSIPSILKHFLWMLCIYFLLSTTVHPWYILFPLALGVFTNYKFPLVWSFVVFLSYYAYKSDGFSESGYILCLEYGVLLGVIIYDLLEEKLKPYFVEFLK